MLKLTKRAVEYIKQLLEKGGIEYPGGMRFGVKAGKCHGLYYFHQVVKEDSRDDHIMFLHGVRILVDHRSMDMLRGTEIDLSDNLLDGPFKYNNPNTKSSCGCGTSFELKD